MNNYNINCHYSLSNFFNEETKAFSYADIASDELKNLKKIIRSESKIEFREFFYRLKNQNKYKEAAFLINELLKDANEDFILKNREPYLFITKNISKIYPEVNKYFTNPMIQSPTKIISPKGLEVILDILKEKGSLKDMGSIVCSNFNELEIQMLKTIEGMENQSPLHRCCFHVRCFGKYKKSRHVAPIYLEKLENGKYISFLTDSVGGNGMGYIIFSIANDILNKANISVTKYIYTGKARQKDETNCPVFSINDSLYFAKHSEELKEWAKKYGKKDEEEGVILLNTLPLKMMKTTQFLPLLQKLEEEANESIGLNFKHLQMSRKGRVFNAKIVNTYFKYERFIIEKAIKNEYLTI